MLERVLTEIVRRHETLRTCFPSLAGRPFASVSTPAPVEPTFTDLRRMAPKMAEQELSRLTTEALGTPFDLARGPLFRVLLFRLGPGSHALLLIVHELIADGRSMDVIESELATLYRAYATGGASPLAEPALQYGDFAAWQRQRLAGEEGAALRQYWEEHLAGVPATLNLPFDSEGWVSGDQRSASASLRLPERLACLLGSLAREERASTFIVYLAVFGALLHRYTGEDDLAVVTPGAGRQHREVEDMVGLFMNRLILRSDLGGDPTFRALVRQVRRTALAAYAHQECPTFVTHDWLASGLPAGLMPLFPVWFRMDRARAADPLGLPGLWTVPLSLGASVSAGSLELSVVESLSGPANVSLKYDPDRFRPGEADRLLGHFHQLVAGAAENPDTRLSRLPVLDKRQQQQAIAGSKRTAARRACERCLHHLVEEQAATRPTAVALVEPGQSLTYGELNAAANQFARLLLARGCMPHDVVGVTREPSSDLLVAVLGILKCGAACALLDASLEPSERERRSAEAGVALVAPVSIDAAALASEPADNLRLDVAPGDIALAAWRDPPGDPCVGVLLEHRSVANAALWQQRAHGFGPADEAVHLTSGEEGPWALRLWPYLAGGASVALPPAPAGSVDRGVEPRPYWKLEAGGVVAAPPLRPGSDANVGRPIDNVQVSVLDRYGNPLPLGAVGEVCVGGAAVPRALLGPPSATEEALVADPFSADPVSRLLRTGDLGRLHGDGTLDVFGRMCDEVVVRGYRLTGEFERLKATILAHAAVRGVTVRLGTDGTGRQRVEALVWLDQSMTPIRDFERYLVEQAPAQRVPYQYVIRAEHERRERPPPTTRRWQLRWRRPG